LASFWIAKPKHTTRGKRPQFFTLVAAKGRAVPPDISLSNMGKSQPQNEFCKSF